MCICEELLYVKQRTLVNRPIDFGAPRQYFV